jgi:outer membrane protein OmpU
MNNFKKIGLSALAGSLVATSAFAGEVTVAGSASMGLEHINGGAANSGKSFSMGNQLTFSGGGELENGLDVSISFVLDQGDNETNVEAGASEAPFDSHSVSIGSDAMGTITMHGEGGSSAAGAVDGSAGGGIWDLFMAAADEPDAAAGASGMLVYSLPSMVDDLALVASYSPKGTGFASSTSYSVVYSGVEGLSLTYAQGSDNASGTSEANQTVMALNYAFGPLTVGYSNSEYDDEAAAGDEELIGYSLAYTVNDNISVTLGSEELSRGVVTGANVAFEGERANITYTAGGMTLGATMASGDNVSYSTAATEDRSVWALSASFAF